MPCHTSAYPSLSLSLSPSLSLSLSSLAASIVVVRRATKTRVGLYNSGKGNPTSHHQPAWTLRGGLGGYIIFTPARSDPGFLPVRARGRPSGRASADHKNDPDLTRRPSRKKKSRKKRGVEMGKADSLFLK